MHFAPNCFLKIMATIFAGIPGLVLYLIISWCTVQTMANSIYSIMLIVKVTSCWKNEMFDAF